MSIETYGRYQLLKKLATGGMAQIYLARQAGLEGFEKLVVVKRILPHLAENDDFITMFLDEARIAARLNHPNIVQIFDLGAQDDTFFIAMEYIHGEDVRRVWKQAERLGSPIPLPLVLRIVIEACNGLDYAHKKADQSGRPLNIVHRDISPQNILVSFEGHVKVVDFGIAKAADQATVTKSGVLKGKYSYMSPEQASGEPLDCRTDIFALGVVLYELLTGIRLFKRSNDIQTLNAVMECAIDPPSKVSERAPKDLDAIVMRALAKRREDRYPEARQLAADLEEWLLARKLPSSTVHLAGFLQDIYADRLAQEAEEGRLMFIESEGSRPDGERATPQSSSNAPRATKSMRTSGPRAQTASLRPQPSGEATAAERPSRSGAISKPRAVTKALEELEAEQAELSGKRAVTEVSMPTQTDRTTPSRKGLVLAAAAAAVGLIGVAIWALRPATQPPAEVVVTSAPPGAAVSLDGKEIARRAPCTVSPGSAGPHRLAVALDGYEPMERQVEVPATGRVEQAFTLVPLSKPVPVPVAPSPVAVHFGSEPAGATVSIGDEVKGKTPLDLQLTPGETVVLKVEHDGFVPVIDKLEVPSEPGAPHEYTLKPVKKDGPGPVVVKKNPDPGPKNPPVETRGVGTVRFVVEPYAVVECGTHKLGETPFPDPQLPAGEYLCTFANPDFPGKQTRTVRVEAGKLVKVPKVTFSN